MVAAYIVLERHLRVPYGNPQEAVRERGRVTKKKKKGRGRSRKRKIGSGMGLLKPQGPFPVSYLLQ